MCGLTAVLTATQSLSPKTIFRQLLFVSQLRGKHSTGVCSINSAGKAYYYKRAVCATDFLQLAGYSNTIDETSKFMLGHARHATIGGKTDNNAHPFAVGRICLFHNGTVRTSSDIAGMRPAWNSIETDSEKIAHCIAHHEDTKEVLESIDGAYALMWYDSDDHTVNFARNSERTLFIAKNVVGDVFVSSEKEMLSLVLKRNESADNIKITMLPIGNWVKYNIDKFVSEKPVVVKFKPKKPPVVVSSYTGGGTYYNDQSSFIQGARPATGNYKSTYSSFKDAPDMFAIGKLFPVGKVRPFQVNPVKIETNGLRVNQVIRMNPYKVLTTDGFTWIGGVEHTTKQNVAILGQSKTLKKKIQRAMLMATISKPIAINCKVLAFATWNIPSADGKTEFVLATTEDIMPIIVKQVKGVENEICFECGEAFFGGDYPVQVGVGGDRYYYHDTCYDEAMVEDARNKEFCGQSTPYLN